MISKYPPKDNLLIIKWKVSSQNGRYLCAQEICQQLFHEAIHLSTTSNRTHRHSSFLIGARGSTQPHPCYILANNAQAVQSGGNDQASPDLRAFCETTCPDSSKKSMPRTGTSGELGILQKQTTACHLDISDMHSTEQKKPDSKESLSNVIPCTQS